MALSLGGAAGMEQGSVVAQSMAWAEAPVSTRVSVAGSLGVARDPFGAVGLLDGTLALPVVVREAGTWVARVSPGLSLPIGTVGTGGVATMRSTGSPDPTLSADLAGGDRVVGLGFASVRVPLVAGRDGVRDGTFLRADALGGLRAGRFVPVAGLSVLRQSADALGARSYDELTVVAGSSVHLGSHWGLDLRGRLPVTGSGAPAAVVLRATTVLGSPRSSAH